MIELTKKTLVQMGAEIVAAASAGAAVKDRIGREHNLSIPVTFAPLAEIFEELSRRDTAARSAETLRAEVRDSCANILTDTPEAFGEALKEPPEKLLDRVTALVETLQQRLDRIANVVKADADDMTKMRDGSKLTRAGVVECLAYWQEEAETLRAERDAALQRVAELEEQITALALGGNRGTVKVVLEDGNG